VTLKIVLEVNIQSKSYVHFLLLAQKSRLPGFRSKAGIKERKKWTKRKGRPTKMVSTAEFTLEVGNVPSSIAKRRFFKVPLAFPLPKKNRRNELMSRQSDLPTQTGLHFRKGYRQALIRLPSCAQQHIFKPSKSMAVWGGGIIPCVLISAKCTNGCRFQKLSTAEIIGRRGGCLIRRVSISTSFLWFLSLDEQRKEQHSSRSE
jgi:hypothetical protein